MPSKNQVAPEAPIVRIEEWLLMILVTLIPGLNFIVLGIFAFKNNGNPNRKNFARAAFGLIVVMTMLIVIGLLI